MYDASKPDTTIKPKKKPQTKKKAVSTGSEMAMFEEGKAHEFVQGEVYSDNSNGFNEVFFTLCVSILPLPT